MLIRHLNDDEAALRALAKVLAQIQPDQVHIVLPERPPAEPWVEPADAEGLLRAEAILGPIAQVVHPFTNSIHLHDYATPEEAIVGIVTRHPMSEAQLIQALNRWSPEQVIAALRRLQAAGAVQPVERLGMCFWAAADMVFP